MTRKWYILNNRTCSTQCKGGLVHVFLSDGITNRPMFTVKDFKCKTPRHLQLAGPHGSALWATDDDDLVLCEEGRVSRRMGLRSGDDDPGGAIERALCLAVSRSRPGIVWVGTDKGHLFSLHEDDGAAKKLPIELTEEGGAIWQIEEVCGGAKLVVRHAAGDVPNVLSVASTTATAEDGEARAAAPATVDWPCEAAFPAGHVSAFSAVPGDVVVFGHEKKIKFLPT